MPRIQTEELLSRPSEGDFIEVRLKGLQDGSFYLMLETAEGSFILENAEGSIKQYPKVDHALIWLKRITDLKQLVVDIEIWRSDKH